MSASGKLREKERFSSSNNRMYMTPTETAMPWQFSKATRHQLPSRTVLPFDPTGTRCHPLHFMSPTCWPVGAAQVFGEPPKGSLAAVLQCCTCLVNQGKRTVVSMGLPATLGAFIRAKHPTQNYLYLCYAKKTHDMVSPLMKKTR